MAFPDKPLCAINIRLMTMDDVPAVTEIDRAGDSNPWTQNIFRRELQISFAQTLVAVCRHGQGDRIAGFITFWMVADEVQLHKMVVRQQYRRRGIAGKLFQTMMDQALLRGFSKVTLEVRCTNEAAIRFYEAFGCRVVAVRKSYYDGAGGDALMMSADVRLAASLKD